MVFGRPCSGKTTIAQSIIERLKELNIPHVYFDNDAIRRTLNSDLGFDRDSRIENIRRVAQMTKTISDQGILVVASFVTPYRELQELARNILGSSLVEVYVKASLEICEERDVKGMYKKARNNEIDCFTGVSDPFDEPLNPNFCLDTETHSIEECTQKVLDYILQLDNKRAP